MKPEEVAEQYAASGASCISVLTEEQFFGGRIGYLERMGRAGLPLLRKDFIFHQLQVMETASTPASALLLIVRLTPDARTLRVLREQAEAYGMHAVVEVFDPADLDIARFMNTGWSIGSFFSLSLYKNSTSAASPQRSVKIFSSTRPTSLDRSL